MGKRALDKVTSQSHVAFINICAEYNSLIGTYLSLVNVKMTYSF